MKTKWLAVGIILLFLGTIVVPANAQNTEKTLPTSRGWLYVGGSGPGNYSRIQDAVYSSQEGDTIFVYHGTYPEKVSLYRDHVNLIGEDKDTTIINVQLILRANNCLVSGFSIFGIDIKSDSKGDYNIISENNITSSDFGIHVFGGCTGNIISLNYIHNIIHEGIWDCGTNTLIINNTISSCGSNGIDCMVGSHSRICNNTIEKNGNGAEFSGGIMLMGDPNNQFETHYYVSQNLIKNNNPTGVSILDSYYNIIEKNDFINNSINAYFVYENHGESHNFWGRNYWSDSKLRILPKLIFGKKSWGGFYINFQIPWFNIDLLQRIFPNQRGV